MDNGSSDSFRGNLDLSWHGLAFIVGGIVLALLLPAWRTGPFLTFVPKAGVSAFAIAYLDAQLIERIIEPFNKAFGNNGEIAKLRADGSPSTLIPAAEKGKGDKEDKDDKVKLSSLETQRMFSIWGFASLLGIVLCYLTIGLYATVGGTFTGLPVNGYALDAILSGIIVGAGTKPLHDLIEYLNAPKSGTAKS
jgi:hypothetical protein